MNKIKEILIVAGALACLAGCVGDFAFTYFFGSKYPGYSNISDTMSSLGATVSPVSYQISLWWVILGVLFIIYAAGFRAAFSPSDRFAKISFWLLIIYGLGEGMGSGLFKADLIDNKQGASFIIHDIFGGIGVFAILIFPLIVKRISSLSSNSAFTRYSTIVFISGLLFLILFSLRYVVDIFGTLAAYKGLWQRLFVLDSYLFLLVIAFIMIKNTACYNKLSYRKDKQNQHYLV